MRTGEHTSVSCRLIAVVGEHVPAADHQIVESGERDEIPYHLRLFPAVAVGLDSAELGQRAHGIGLSPADQTHARREGRGHGSKPGYQHPEPA